MILDTSILIKSDFVNWNPSIGKEAWATFGLFVLAAADSFQTKPGAAVVTMVFPSICIKAHPKAAC